MGHFKLNKKDGSGYAIASLLKAGATPVQVTSTAPLDDEFEASQQYPIDLFGKICFAQYSGEGPEGPAVYSVCLVHETMKRKLQELAVHHPLGLFPVHTAEYTHHEDGAFQFENIAEVHGINVILGPAARRCPGSVLGLSDWPISKKELSLIIGLPISRKDKVNAQLQLVAKHLFTKMYPAVKPTFWIIVGIALGKLADLIISKV